MKTCLLTVAFLSCALAATAQTQQPTRPFELGLEAVNYTPLPGSYRKTFQWAPGVLFRYVPRRLGVRAGLNVSRSDTRTGTDCADCITGTTTAKTLSLKLGGQYAPLPRATWLYTFLDLYYQRINSEGQYSGGISGLAYTENRRAKGLGLNLGLGATLHLLKHVALSPEVYYDGYLADATHTQLDRRTASLVTFRSTPQEHRPAARLLATFAW